MDVCVAIPFRVHARMTDVDLVLNYSASFAELVVRKDCCLPGSDAVYFLIVWCQRFGGSCLLQELLSSLTLDMKYKYMNILQRYTDVII